MRPALLARTLIVLTGAAALLAGCKTVTAFREDSQAPRKVAAPVAADCSKGGPGCPPIDRRQYYDDKTARYYYFDPSTGRYFWENGDPRF